MRPVPRRPVPARVKSRSEWEHAEIAGGCVLVAWIPLFTQSVKFALLTARILVVRIALFTKGVMNAF